MSDLIEALCMGCRHDQAFQQSKRGEDSCPIAAAMHRYEWDDPQYPKELTGGTCTAFQSIDKPEPRDENAAVGDLFA